MDKLKYVLKRLALMLITSFIIMFICFVLIKMLEPEMPMMGEQVQNELRRREALGYNKPILVQFGIYLRNIVTDWDWGTSWKIDYMTPATEVLADRLPPTILLNLYSIIFSVPVGIFFGIIAALYKNTFIDYIISTLVMVFISVPSFVYAFILQYTLGFKLGLFPLVMSSLHDAGYTYFSSTMFLSMVMPVLSLSFGSVATFARFTRAELTEALTSDYMLLARTKGLSQTKATVTHALRNAMVPILPSILARFLGVLSGSMVIERIFSINGVGSLYLQSINLRDYDLFTMTAMFYTVIGLTANIIVDLSYGFLDPRVRMGER